MQAYNSSAPASDTKDEYSSWTSALNITHDFKSLIAYTPIFLNHGFPKEIIRIILFYLTKEDEKQLAQNISRLVCDKNIKVLLDLEIKIDQESDKEKLNAHLLESVRSGDMAMAKLLLSIGADPDTPDQLYITATRKTEHPNRYDYKETRDITIVCCDIKKYDSMGWYSKNAIPLSPSLWYEHTPLHMAVINGHTEMVKLLLAHKANPNSNVLVCVTYFYTDEDRHQGLTPHLFKDYQHEYVDSTVAPRKKYEKSLSGSSITSLSLSVVKNHMEITKLLLSVSSMTTIDLPTNGEYLSEYNYNHNNYNPIILDSAVRN